MTRGATRTRLALACAPLLALACTMGPDYRRPKLEVPERFRSPPPPSTGEVQVGAVAQPGAPPLGELDWWALYHDGKLRALIRTALERNYDLRIAVSRIEQARALLGSTRMEQLPTVDARAGVTHQRLPATQIPAGVDRDITLGSLSANLSWELDFWGRVRRTTEAARAQLLAAQYGRRAVQISLIADVATAYMQLVTFDEQLEITRKTVTTREEFLKLTRAQSQGGVASGLDVAAAEAQLAAAQANIPELERQIAQTENALSLLLGRNPGPIGRIEPGTVVMLAAPEIPAGLPSSLLERRPDVLQAEQELVAANARVGAAKAALFPRLSLTGALGLIAPDLSGLFDSSAPNWSAGVSAVQPLLDPQRNAYQVDLADARKREAILRYELTVRSAFREVADALVARQKLSELERWQRALVDAQTRAESLATSRYRVGYSSYFDVINAGRDLFEAQLALSSARLRSLVASVQLYRALGGGWQVPKESAAR